MQPTVKLRTEINVPKCFPKIKPETKANGDAKPNNNIQIIEKNYKQKDEKNIMVISEAKGSFGFIFNI